MSPTANTSPQGIRPEAHRASGLFRLPFSRRSWQGTQGGWAGQGTGNSIDFQDHRSYQWGDDPRGIHWAAYARTGQLTMKVYRAELAPLTDIAVDVSASMFLTEQRTAVTLELLQFCLLSALSAGSRTNVYAVKGAQILPLNKEMILAGQWPQEVTAMPPDEAMPANIPWRHNGLKVLISDLLFAGDPSPLTNAMGVCGGLSVIFAPTLQEEARMPQTGNTRLMDCETGHTRTQYISAALARRYEHAYAAHFNLWSDACRLRRIALACVPCHLPLSRSLAAEALHHGAVELI